MKRNELIIVTPFILEPDISFGTHKAKSSEFFFFLFCVAEEDWEPSLPSSLNIENSNGPRRLWDKIDASYTTEKPSRVEIKKKNF